VLDGYSADHREQCLRVSHKTTTSAMKSGSQQSNILWFHFKNSPAREIPLSVHLLHVVCSYTQRTTSHSSKKLHKKTVTKHITITLFTVYTITMMTTICIVQHVQLGRIDMYITPLGTSFIEEFVLWAIWQYSDEQRYCEQTHNHTTEIAISMKVENPQPNQSL